MSSQKLETRLEWEEAFTEPELSQERAVELVFSLREKRAEARVSRELIAEVITCLQGRVSPGYWMKIKDRYM